MTPPEQAQPTRLCSLPWESFTVRLVDGLACSPCRHFPPVWDAQDLDAVDAGLREVRHALLHAKLPPPCQSCPEMPLGTPEALQAMLAQKHLVEGNQQTTAIRAAVSSKKPLPPPELMYRVIHSRNGYDFVGSGVVNLAEILPHLLPHLPAGSPRLLDFGCGCGRFARLLLENPLFGDYTGCDIDAEAINWCREFLPRGRFQTILPDAPLSMRDGSFTAVIGYSVMTHLTRDFQDFWLAELHRVTAQGAILALTIHGETAAKKNGLEARLAGEGIIDDIVDDTLQGIAPAGYYRATFQNPAHVKRVWGKRFDVLEHIDGAMMGYQDLVILRRR
ncbi:class I SAM-dependent methyltransferase [Ottowia thiooxydans]|uniref:class I SAM-dependent methyltransferase n=1 Tax=Ottowia thiooxydans TaxID=219182 RepID=UPI00048A873D|nr:class I SAM-dependent methyltransferase [Ottowia thiooxydans]